MRWRQNIVLLPSSVVACGRHMDISLRWNFYLVVIAMALISRVGRAKNFVAGNLVTLNDNGGWGWFQGGRGVIDQASGRLLLSSVACSDGVDGKERSGDVDVASYPLGEGTPGRFVLHHN